VTLVRSCPDDGGGTHHRHLAETQTGSQMEGLEAAPARHALADQAGDPLEGTEVFPARPPLGAERLPQNAMPKALWTGAPAGQAPLRPDAQAPRARQASAQISQALGPMQRQKVKNETGCQRE